MRLSQLKKLVEQISASAGGAAVEDPHVVNTAGEPSYTAPWVTQFGNPVKFYKVGEQAFISGRVSTPSGTSNRVFNLPEDYRPPKLSWFRAVVRDTDGFVIPTALVQIYGTDNAELAGDVMVQSPDNTAREVMLDGINFRVA